MPKPPTGPPSLPGEAAERAAVALAKVRAEGLGRQVGAAKEAGEVVVGPPAEDIVVIVTGPASVSSDSPFVKIVKR